MFGSGSGALYHHCGLENESKNNILHRQSTPSNGQKPVSNVWGACEANSGKFQSFRNHHNIYFFDNTEDLKLYKSHNWFDEKTEFRDNLFFSLDPTDEFKEMFPPSDLAFADLPSVGSVRNKWQDPKFENVEEHNYRLTDDSPAFEMGIQMPEFGNFGIQNNRQPFYLKK